MNENKISVEAVSDKEEQKDVLLKIEDLTVEFKTEMGIKQAINHLNLTIHKGEALGLVGEAGAGKTTTALSILRLLSPTAAILLSLIPTAP